MRKHLKILQKAKEDITEVILDIKKNNQLLLHSDSPTIEELKEINLEAMIINERIKGALIPELKRLEEIKTKKNQKKK